jgi:hypothetical protein
MRLDRFVPEPWHEIRIRGVKGMTYSFASDRVSRKIEWSRHARE